MTVLPRTIGHDFCRAPERLRHVQPRTFEAKARWPNVLFDILDLWYAHTRLLVAFLLAAGALELHLAEVRVRGGADEPARPAAQLGHVLLDFGQRRQLGLAQAVQVVQVSVLPQEVFSLDYKLVRGKFCGYTRAGFKKGAINFHENTKLKSFQAKSRS